MVNGNRTLTDADVEAISQALYDKITDDFYKDLGKGIWSIVRKVVVAAILFVLGYGAYQNGGIK